MLSIKVGCRVLEILIQPTASASPKLSFLRAITNRPCASDPNYPNWDNDWVYQLWEGVFIICNTITL